MDKEKKKVLVVDDEEDVLRVLDKRLSDAGYAVLKANNGKEAINIAKNSRPDLIILDIVMPGIGGAEVAGALKEDKDTRDIPVIFLTCLVKKEEEAAGKHIGGNYFIAKPYNPDDLVKEIRSRL